MPAATPVWWKSFKNLTASRRRRSLGSSLQHETGRRFYSFVLGYGWKSRSRNKEEGMKTAMIAWPLAAALGAGAVAGAQETAPLQPGEYQVSIRLELPHIEGKGLVTTMASICVPPGDAGTQGLFVLSDLNPLRSCPASNVRRNGDTLTFDIACPASDAAVGSASYTIRAEHFDGTIAVKMGGKNMTMVERQSGRRVGNCK
jgi:hypothetical protein